jgi:hypothetical protein
MYFVSRWRETNPLGKQVVLAEDRTILDWFQRNWTRDNPEEWIDSELDGGAYGLESIFEQARELNLNPPKTTDELRELLYEHLYVEGDEDYIRLGEHALRVRTDDDEVDLAYYLIDEVSAAAVPDRLSFLLHDPWPLPGQAGGAGGYEASFNPGIPVRNVTLGADGGEKVFSVRLCWESPDVDHSLDLRGAIVLSGTGLPDLASRLLAADQAQVSRWPYDVQLLRALVAPGETGIDRALERYTHLGGYNPGDEVLPSSGPPDQPAPGRSRSGPAEKAHIQLDEHLKQVARYIDDFFGFDQWFIFDSRWAAAHLDLASSLLRYAAHWDPFA